MIGKTNVNERNTQYRIGSLDVGVTEEHEYSPADYGLDYFDHVAVSAAASNPFKEMCMGHTVNFTPVEVGNSITTVASYLFYRQSLLRQVIVPSSVHTVEQYSFYGTGARTMRVDCPLLSSVTTSSFCSNRSMTSLYLNAPLLTSNNGLFSDSLQLSQVDLISIPHLGMNFFYNTPMLPYLEIPADCASFGERVFDLNQTQFAVAVDLHLVFLRHAVSDGAGNYTTQPTQMSQNALGNRAVAKMFIHVPLDSLLDYRRVFAVNSYNANYVPRIFAYSDCAVGDALPTSVTQQAAGYNGQYTLDWYTDKEHTTPVSSGVATEARRYFAVATVVSESAD